MPFRSGVPSAIRGTSTAGACPTVGGAVRRAIATTAIATRARSWVRIVNTPYLAGSKRRCGRTGRVRSATMLRSARSTKLSTYLQTVPMSTAARPDGLTVAEETVSEVMSRLLRSALRLGLRRANINRS